MVIIDLGGISEKVWSIKRSEAEVSKAIVREILEHNPNVERIWEELMNLQMQVRNPYYLKQVILNMYVTQRRQ